MTMLYLLIALIALDVVLTLIGLHDGHTEQNKLMAWLILDLPALGLLAVRLHRRVGGACGHQPISADEAANDAAKGPTP